MRIVAGTRKGRQLRAPTGQDIRPTTDRVREALFNRLAAYGLLEGADVLDAFAGTGALGFEALSRGAKQATFFDTSQKAIDLVCENAKNLQLDEKSSIERRDATKPQRAPSPASLIFLDPPYGKGLVEKALLALEKAGWFSDDVTIIAEMAPEDAFQPPPFLQVTDDRKYGSIRILTLEKTA